MASESDKCYLFLVEAVNENSRNKLERAKRVYSEIELFASLVQCNEEGETLLATAMKMKNVSIIHELVSMLKRCDLTIEENKLKLFIAFNQLPHQIPIADILGYLLEDCRGTWNIFDSNWFKLIAEVFIQSTSFTRQDKIIALELTGASLIASYKNVIRFNFVEKSIFALNWWREAMALRYFPTNGESLLPKANDVCVPSESYAVVFGSAVEFTTMEELDFLQKDLERHSSSLYDNAALLSVKRMLIIQALLVTRRFFTQANLVHPHQVYLKNFFEFAEFVSRRIEDEACYKYLPAHPGTYERIRPENALLPVMSLKLVTNIYLHILELMNGFDPKMLSYQSCFDICNALIHLLSRFEQTIWNSSNGPGSEEELTYYNLLVPTESIAMIFKFAQNQETISTDEYDEYSPWDNIEDYFHFSGIIYSFLFVLNSISPRLTKEEKQKLEEYYSQYIRDLVFQENHPTTILHEALDSHKDYDYHPRGFSVETINLILQLGADVNAIDGNGRTPLHLLARTSENHMKENYLLAFQTLVDAGADLYLAANDGETVISILKKNLMKYNQCGEFVVPYFESLINDVFPLTCLCARVIRRHRIPFEDRLPPRLQALILPRTAQRQWYERYTNHHKFLFLN
jgi:hypothetical protein